jgi:hypothetical protein
LFCEKIPRSHRRKIKVAPSSSTVLLLATNLTNEQESFVH